jgi:hypothetical protein
MYALLQLQKMGRTRLKARVCLGEKFVILMFSILSILFVILAPTSYSHFAKAVSESSDEPQEKTIFYGCGVYESPIFIGRLVVHCDPLRH